MAGGQYNLVLIVGKPGNPTNFRVHTPTLLDLITRLCTPLDRAQFPA
ncbi:hypothetical protein PG5_02680 [Pseudomonas sp. G5(2012)]|nr:hypothetical protein PG5_02680 [Pseudomonas sp. G5(2012)]